MADTKSSWDLGHVLGIVGGAAVGAALLPIAVPTVLGIAGVGAAATALGISVSSGVGAIAGGWLGHKATVPVDPAAK